MTLPGLLHSLSGTDRRTFTLLIPFITLFFICPKAQDTLYLFGDTIRVGELEWDMEKDWRDRGELISQNKELYGEHVHIYLNYYSNRSVEQIVFGYLDEDEKFVPHGPARYYYNSGQLLGKRYYEEGRLNGPVIDYYKNGTPLSRTRYTDGKLDGKYESWYVDGTPEHRGRYKEGVLHGTYRAWYANGRPKWVEHFDHGVRTGTDSTFYETGKVKFTLELRDGIEHGAAMVYHRNGRPWTKRRYENGRLVEVVFLKSKDGRPLEIGGFGNGDGWLNIYNEDGILIERDKYRNGWYRRTKVVQK